MPEFHDTYGWQKDVSCHHIPQSEKPREKPRIRYRLVFVEFFFDVKLSTGDALPAGKYWL